MSALPSLIGAGFKILSRGSRSTVIQKPGKAPQVVPNNSPILTGQPAGGGASSVPGGVAESLLGGAEAVSDAVLGAGEFFGSLLAPDQGGVSQPGFAEPSPTSTSPTGGTGGVSTEEARMRRALAEQQARRQQQFENRQAQKAAEQAAKQFEQQHELAAELGRSQAAAQKARARAAQGQARAAFEAAAGQRTLAEAQAGRVRQQTALGQQLGEQFPDLFESITEGGLGETETDAIENIRAAREAEIEQGFQDALNTQLARLADRGLGGSSFALTAALGAERGEQSTRTELGGEIGELQLGQAQQRRQQNLQLLQSLLGSVF